MHKDKVEELKQVLKGKKDLETAGQQVPVEQVPPVLAEDTQELEEKLKKAQTQAQENNEKYLRLYAEFENYRKRVSREKEEYTRFAHEQVVKDLLPVLDDLERALTHAQSAAEVPALIEGVEMVKKHLISALEKYELKTFESFGKPFDPHVHEAVSHQESADFPPDTVMNEYRKGYTLRGKLVRPALVVVSKSLGS